MKMRTCPRCGYEFKWDTETAKIFSERVILSALKNAKNSQMRHGELLEETGLSSKTLSSRLKDLLEKKAVARIVVVDEGYPPPVFYKLERLELGELLPGYENDECLGREARG